MSAEASTSATVPSSINDEGLLEVEKILRKVVRGKKVWYLIKWAGFGPEDNTWEPPENLAGCSVLAEFEAKELERKKRKKRVFGAAKKRKSSSKKHSLSPTSSQSSVESPSPDPAETTSVPAVPSVFDNGWVPERVVTALKTPNGQIRYAIKWKDREVGDIVTSEEARRCIPHMLCEFYEETLPMWPLEDSDDEEDE